MTNQLIIGIPVIPKVVSFPLARFLSKEQVQEYQQRIQEEYKNNPNALSSLDVLSFDDRTQEPTGSNPFALHKLASMGIIPASIATLETLVETNPEVLKGHYEDYLAQVIRDPRDSFYKTNNPVIADLLEQAKKRTKIEFPTLVSGLLEPVEASNGYGLSFKLTDSTTIFHAPELAYKNDGRKFLRLDEKGVPIFLSDKEISQLGEEEKNKLRTFYAKQDGLSRLYLGRYLALVSGRDSLDGSDSDGRVVVESATGAQESFRQKLISRYQQEQQKLAYKFERAMRVLEGKE